MLPDEKTLVTLQKLGPTYYGARIYETLVLLGPSDATRLSAESGVPRTRVNDILRRLETEGWITSEHTRPITYIARYPRGMDCYTSDLLNVTVAGAAEDSARRISGWVLPDDIN